MSVLAALSLALSQLGCTSSAAQESPKPPEPSPSPKEKEAAAAPATSGEGVVAKTDEGWPRAYVTPSKGTVTVYQPQVASWLDQRHLVAYAAVQYEAAAAQKPALGTVKLEADTKVSVEERLVNFSHFQISEANFPSLPKDQLKEVVAQIDEAIPDDDRIISLDRVLAAVDKSQIVPKDVAGVKADPPQIFFSQTPAILVNLDGEPIWSPIKDNNLKFAVNTNWDLFRDETTSTLYLRNDKTWLKAPDLKGPWTPAGALPESFQKLPADENWSDVKAALPGNLLDPKKMPTVFVSTPPGEMILLDGKPVYEPVEGTSLVWVSNTEADVFRLGPTGAVYFLVAGRWFSSPGFEGPWTFASLKLPEDFQKIPLEHPRSHVLAAVPGTQQAAEAVLLAQVPQTARVNKKTLKAPEVKYSGDPQFQKIENTKVERAVNTDKSIIKVGDMYYMCFEGVWFMGTSPNGPWTVASKVPGEIYEIPITSPANNVTYVTVQEDDSDDEWVTFATAAMYTGVMIAWGCAVWGSGYYYPPYYGGFYGGYPRYYGHYPTYGYRASYNPWTGAYGRSAVAYGPYGGAGVGARYNPTTGTYARGAAAYGPYGSRAAGSAYNPRTGAYATTRQGSNVYGSWGTTSVQRGNQWATTTRVTSNVTGNTARVTRTSNGDVYAGRDGNVYRNQGGSWQKYDNGSWNAADRPANQPAATGQRTQSAGTTGTTGPQQRTSQSGTTPQRNSSATTNQLNRDSAARSSGNQRTKDYSNYQKSGSSNSYRSSGSSRRSGGGGRRRP
jgi:hypothetical protein